jgi:hypothetical protein
MCTDPTIEHGGTRTQIQLVLRLFLRALCQNARLVGVGGYIEKLFSTFSFILALSIYQDKGFWFYNE